MSLTAIATRSDWVDVTPPGLSKATALEQVRARHSASRSMPRRRSATARTTSRCCDGPRSAIVMGHAPGARPGASRTAATGTIDDDGAAAALRSLLA